MSPTSGLLYGFAVASLLPLASEHAARVRAWCIDLGVRAAHAAAAATAGSANLLDHAAQRLFREPMLCSLTAQTRDPQAATVQ
ncbi:hypothetical protein WMF37_35140 [Sorangium sp. So ce291]|uniref:hypothetical protein n=1 Tax=Sorangium sp. So ce291 TaxID=3133294 RepID=UPI003F62B593